MHALQAHVAKQLADKVRSRHVVIWYDPRSEFGDLVGELRTGASDGAIQLGDQQAVLIEYAGSMFEIRSQLESGIAGSDPVSTLVYISGQSRDPHSVLLEAEEAGFSYEPKLRSVARAVLRQDYTDGQIDALLAPEARTYADLVAAIEAGEGDAGPSLLKPIYHGTNGDPLIAAWVADDTNDPDINAKGARSELYKLIRSRLECEIVDDVELSKARSIVQRYLLSAEFLGDLTGEVPSAFGGVSVPRTKDGYAAVKGVLAVLRGDHPDVYAEIAETVEDELGLTQAELPASVLGTVDTFPFEERVLLGHCSVLIVRGEYGAAKDLVDKRQGSFWLTRNAERSAQWEASARMAELGSTATAVLEALNKAPRSPEAWINAYAEEDGWYRLDTAQRRLETWVAELDEEPDVQALSKVRQLYDDAARAMARGYADALVSASWDTGDILLQTDVWPDELKQQPEPVAYFLVDAMRYEMGHELTERLGHSNARVRPAVAQLPTITPIGMAALHPGAAGDFGVDVQKGRFASTIEGTFMQDVNARKSHAAARVPGLVDMTLGSLLDMSDAKLAKQVAGAPVVMVRSQEIDAFGEGGLGRLARKAMDMAIDDIARAVRKLAKAGIGSAVISADHGHLFYPTDRSEAWRMDAPGGDTADLHRRCWIGKGGATPDGCIRVAAGDVGYASDLDFVFPRGLGVFKAGGDLAFHHGGISLQEMIVPVVVVKTSTSSRKGAHRQKVEVTNLPGSITNLFFPVAIRLGGDTVEMFPLPLRLQLVLASGNRQVGTAEIATGAELDSATGTLVLQPAETANVVLRLTDPEVKSVRVVVLDPATDAQLYRSDEIAVKLMIG